MSSSSETSQTEHDEIRVEIAKIRAETARLNKPMEWYVPVLYATGGAGFVLLAILLGRFILIEFSIPPQ